MDYQFEVLTKTEETIRGPSFLKINLKKSCANVSRVVGSEIHSPFSFTSPLNSFPAIFYRGGSVIEFDISTS